MPVSANSQGQVTGWFTIPDNVPPGTKLVEFDGAGGSHGSATFVGRGQITVRELRQIRTEHTIITTHLEAYDPLAETFTLAEPRFVSGVELWFCAKGTTGRLLVQIRETGNGVPTRGVLAEASLPTASVTLNQFHRFTWPPVRLEAGVEYAVVVLCDDAVTAVGVAELGKFDSAQQRWVTSQPYQVGVLLSSSNASTWTPHQDKDLTFRLLASPITATTLTINFPDITVASTCDEIVVLAAVERPTSACDVTFTVSLPGGESVTFAEGERVLLPYTVTAGQKLGWLATLTGTATDTPRLHPDVQFVYCTRGSPATYVTRAITSGPSNAKVSVYYEANVPAGAQLKIEASPTGAANTWVDVPVQPGAVELGFGWIDTTARITGYNAANVIIRVTLTGGPRNRPQVRKFRVVVT